MLHLSKVAVTGGLSCGKTTVCRFLRELGAYVVSADEIVHGLLKIENPVGQQVLELLGEDILTEGQIDRSKIASKVFTHPKQLDSLEKLLHPIVYDEIKQAYNKALQDKTIPLFVAEVPLLFESGGQAYFDKTIAVVTDQIRFPEALKERMANQMSLAEKAKKADYVIQNNGSIEHLYEEVKSIFNTLTTV